MLIRHSNTVKLGPSPKLWNFAKSRWHLYRGMTLGTSSLKHSTLTRKRGAAAAGRLVTPGHDVCTAAAGVPSPSRQHHTFNIQHLLPFTGLIILTWPLKLWHMTTMFLLLFDFTSPCPQLRCSILACANKNFLLCLQNWIKIGIFWTVVKCIKSIPAPLSSGHVLQMQTFELLKYFSIKLNTAASNNNFRHFTESIEKL